MGCTWTTKNAVANRIQLLLIHTGSQPDSLGKETGAGNEYRTRDLNLGKVALYH